MDRLRELLTEEADVDKSLIQDLPEEESKDHEFIEVISYSVEEGLETASRKLNAGVSDLEYEILGKGSKGFLGIGKKPFRILIKRILPQVSAELQELSDITQKMAKGEIIQDMDGSFKVRVTKKGIMLIVNSPKGKGRRISLQEVQNAIYQKQILDSDARLIEQTVTVAKGEPVKIGEWKPNPELDGKFSTEITDDEMKAYLTIIPPRRN